MTLSSPRSLAQFFDALKFSYPGPFTLVQATEVIRREDGRSISSQKGTAYWRFSATVQTNVHAVAVRYHAMINAVYAANLEVYAYDFRRKYPEFDPTGSIVGSNNVQINSIGSDNSSVSLKGLPASYKLAIGDYIQVTMAAGNLLVQIVEDITANGSGVTAEFQVVPNLPTGIAINNVANLKKPATKFLITPESFDVGNVDLIITDGMTLEFEEAL